MSLFKRGERVLGKSGLMDNDVTNFIVYLKAPHKVPKLKIYPPYLIHVTNIKKLIFNTYAI